MPVRRIGVDQELAAERGARGVVAPRVDVLGGAGVVAPGDDEVSSGVHRDRRLGLGVRRRLIHPELAALCDALGVVALEEHAVDVPRPLAARRSGVQGQRRLVDGPAEADHEAGGRRLKADDLEQRIGHRHREVLGGGGHTIAHVCRDQIGGALPLRRGGGPGDQAGATHRHPERSIQQRELQRLLGQILVGGEDLELEQLLLVDGLGAEQLDVLDDLGAGLVVGADLAVELRHVEDAVVALDAAAGDAAEHRGPAGLVVVDVAGRLAEQLVARLGVGLDGDLVAHRARRHEQSRLLAEQGGGAVLAASAEEEALRRSWKK